MKVTSATRHNASGRLALPNAVDHFFRSKPLVDPQIGLVLDFPEWKYPKPKHRPPDLFFLVAIKQAQAEDAAHTEEATLCRHTHRSTREQS
jgi:hypothetical protein